MKSNTLIRIICFVMVMSFVFVTSGCDTTSEEIVGTDSTVTVTGGETNENLSDKGKSDDKGNGSSGAGADKSQFNPYAGIEKYRGKTVNLAVWWNLLQQEKQAITDFTSKYGIKVSVNTYTYETYATKLAAEIAAGSGPDVFRIDNDDFLTFIHKNLAQPISVGSYDIEKDKAYDLNTMKLLSWNGTMYGVSIANNMTYSRFGLYYNKTMFDNAGVTDPGTLWKNGNWNWDTFADCAKKMTSRKNGKTIYGYTGLDTTIANGWMMTTGSDYVTTDGKTFNNNLTSPSVLKTLTFVSGLRESGYWCPDDSTTAFYNGAAAMLGEGTWMLEKHQTIWTLSDKWGFVPLPCPKGQKEIITYTASAWTIATGAKQPKAASYFLRYWLDFDNIGLKNAIPTSETRQVFEYMSDTSKVRKASVAQGIMSYYDRSMLWQMTNISKKNANDIPVDLKSFSSKVDGVISKILEEAK